MVSDPQIFSFHFGCLESLAFAAVTYYFGSWLKTKIRLLRRLSVASPVVGGLTVAIVLSVLQGLNIAHITFDPTMQKQLMIAFFTTVGLMASLKVVKKGGIMLAFFLLAVSCLTVLQNCLGMSVASLLGIDSRYGIMVGSVSLMGGLGTSAAFGPYFEQTYGLNGATVVAITSATLAMTNSLLIGGPIGEWLIKHYKIKTPDLQTPVEKAANPDKQDERKGSLSWTADILKALTVILICMSLGKVISQELSAYLTL
ncbi:sodium/glutamate symporter, partial [gut metagenome]